MYSESLVYLCTDSSTIYVSVVLWVAHMNLRMYTVLNIHLSTANKQEFYANLHVLFAARKSINFYLVYCNC